MIYVNFWLGIDRILQRDIQCLASECRRETEKDRKTEKENDRQKKRGGEKEINRSKMGARSSEKIQKHKERDCERERERESA